MLNDLELIEQIIHRGNKGAAEELINRYYDDLYRYIFFQTGNKQDAMDLTQDVFISVLNNLSSYDSSKATFRTWLYRIGHYKVVDFYRKRRIISKELKEMDWVEDDDLFENLYSKAQLTKVNDYVATFPYELQEIFNLRVYGSLSFPEISSLLQQNEEKIKAKYYRLIKKIREDVRNDV